MVASTPLSSVAKDGRHHDMAGHWLLGWVQSDMLSFDVLVQGDHGFIGLK